MSIGAGFTRVVIVGGGTAGWMAAAALSKTLGAHLQIELIESDEIGTVGVGEATIPAIKNFHLLLELDEAEFIRTVSGTFKLGIEFENWGELGERYFHPFGPPGADSWAAQFHHYWMKAKHLGEQRELRTFSVEAAMAAAKKFGNNGERKINYAYHFDAGRYARFLRKFSENLGVRRTEGKVVGVASNSNTGFIESVTLESGLVISGDMFIDCSGFRGLLIEQEMQTGWEDWSHWLPCDRAVAVQTESVADPVPYTRSTARACGWQWRIPLQHRVGNGLVYASHYLDDDTAIRLLLDNVDGECLTEPRPIRFRTGRRLKQWNRNCLAIGLSSGFLEPLESTSIHMIQNSIIRFIKLFPAGGIEPTEVEQFNHEAKAEAEFIRDFIILHYHVNRRVDSPFWIDCREMEVPDALAHRIRLFQASGKVFQDPGELFAVQSWVAVMSGQGIVPRAYHPVVDLLSDEDLAGFLNRVQASITHIVDQQPTHQEFIAHHCKAVER